MVNKNTYFDWLLLVFEDYLKYRISYFLPKIFIKEAAENMFYQLFSNFLLQIRFIVVCGEISNSLDMDQTG